MAAKKFVPTEEFNKASAEWMQVAGQLNELKARELELRNQLIKMVYPSGAIPAGVNTFPLAEGWVCKVIGKVNLSVMADLVGEARQMLNDEVAKGKVSPFDFDAVVKFKPELSSGEFNKLTEEQRKIVSFCITSKPGQAGIEFTKPKRAVA